MPIIYYGYYSKLQISAKEMSKSMISGALQRVKKGCLTFVKTTGVSLYGIRSPAMSCRDVETKIQIYPCKHLPPFLAVFFAQCLPWFYGISR